MNVIITGGTKGIGRAIAQRCVQEGCDLVLCSRTRADLELCRQQLNTTNPDVAVHISVVDMRDREAVKEFGDFCLRKLSQVDVLINNAGIFIPGVIHEEDEGALEQMIETNLYSAYHLARKIVPQMKHQRQGIIINMASIASIMAYPNGGSYSISKFALRGFSKVLREELKSYGIKVTTIMPGATWSHSWAGMKDQLPEDRLMQASDVAQTVWTAMTLSDAAVMEEIILRPQLGDL